MIAVSTVDTVGGVILTIVGGGYLVVTGFQGFVRDRCSRSQDDAGGFPGEPVAGHPVEPAGTNAADALEALTFPGPYNRGGMKR